MRAEILHPLVTTDALRRGRYPFAIVETIGAEHRIRPQPLAALAERLRRFPQPVDQRLALARERGLVQRLRRGGLALSAEGAGTLALYRDGTVIGFALQLGLSWY